MDLKCKNCGQFLDEKDKFCRFCGCPAPVKEQPQPKRTARQIEDSIQEAKTVITENELDESCGEWDPCDIIIKTKGSKSALNARAYAMTIISAIIMIGSIISAILVKGLENLNNVAKFTVIMLSIILIFVSLIFLIENAFKIKQFLSMPEKKITIPRYSLKKLPIFAFGGYIFEMDVDKACELCDGDIKGDMHIEKIYDSFVVICNYNRRHFYRLHEADFFNKYLSDMEKSLSDKSVDGD